MDVGIDRYQADWAVMERVWPDGTWTRAWGDCRGPQMDDVTRSVLLACLEAERRQRATHLLATGPGASALGDHAVPGDWKPSASVLEQCMTAGRADRRFKRHVLERLAGMGQLAP